MALPRELGQHYRAAQRGPRYSRSRYVARVFSFLFCAAMRALGAEGASDGPGVVSCSTGSQVVAALADPAVSVAILMNSVGLVEEDFAPYALPIRRTGNFTVLGAHEPRALWPRLDMAYLQNKVGWDGGGGQTGAHRVTPGHTAAHRDAQGRNVHGNDGNKQIDRGYTRRCAPLAAGQGASASGALGHTWQGRWHGLGP